MEMMANVVTAVGHRLVQSVMVGVVVVVVKVEVCRRQKRDSSSVVLLRHVWSAAVNPLKL